MSEKATEQAPTRLREWMRLHPDTVQQVEYWRRKQGLSKQEFYELAVEEKVARASGDFDVPNLAIQRLNQLIDEVRSLSTSTNNLEKIAVNGFDSLLGLTRGDSYLLDAEDGELAVRDSSTQAITN